MSKVVGVRPVLLSAPYGDQANSMENRLHLPSGLRTSGFIEVALADGTVGIGEGYLAVFAPHAFTSIAGLLAPVLLGRDARSIDEIVGDLHTATGYWSGQGAARHVVSALEIALQDCNARLQGIPVWRMLGDAGTTAAPVSPRLALYASGGDSAGPTGMAGELAEVRRFGIPLFKIRARNNQVDKVVWTQRAAAEAGIEVAVDMTQNLVIPSQRTEDVVAFVRAIVAVCGRAPAFLEEVLGPDRLAELPKLRQLTDARLAGGEIVTTPVELIDRIRADHYDIVQPDATVIGGLGAVLEVMDAANDAGVATYVHCWGGGVGVAANFHVAVAGAGSIVEWPLPAYPLREELLKNVVTVTAGEVQLTDAPGLGIELDPAIEREFPFREEAVYRSIVDPTLLSHEPGIWE